MFKSTTFRKLGLVVLLLALNIGLGIISGTDWMKPPQVKLPDITATPGIKIPGVPDGGLLTGKPADSGKPADTKPPADATKPQDKPGDHTASPPDQTTQKPQEPVNATKIEGEEPSGLKAFFLRLLPSLQNLLLGGLLLSIAWLIYNPIRNILNRALDASHASQRGKIVVLRASQLLYWGIAIFLSASVIAPEALSKMFIGVSLFGAALTLALQGMMNDFICGVLLSFSPRFKIGDEVQLVGMEVKGKVVDVGYLATIIETSDATVTVPNRELWSRATKNMKPAPPPPSKIILPPGYDFKKND